MLSANERGATAIEYGLIVGLIAVACIGAFTNLGGGVSGKWGLLLTTISTYM
ncbi:Flp family type IVb pilin [Sphingomonas sp.]|jgi:pilus assembly protein Flp/PilA|uniref:Flp family type IVb pilin n=1 Tax=Sphingomonas sp. TaxID=28214 RepID=UPI002DA0958E|nr:Flp family type IVb pilin [Sphingomonas sp.]HET7595649.1 Flp family type IVb pilin [Burkholderiales bacterium]HEU4969214.1 Flp family type IVb pilin [Sphingomonas sp.]